MPCSHSMTTLRPNASHTAVETAFSARSSAASARSGRTSSPSAIKPPVSNPCSPSVPTAQRTMAASSVCSIRLSSRTAGLAWPSQRRRMLSSGAPATAGWARSASTMCGRSATSASRKAQRRTPSPVS
eukprot:scaffold29905_cov64-Phaeocystis_antarctica.AAC.12